MISGSASSGFFESCTAGVRCRRRNEKYEAREGEKTTEKSNNQGKSHVIFIALTVWTEMGRELGESRNQFEWS
eukprot:766995-Hanusia_phi.AAC.4